MFMIVFSKLYSHFYFFISFLSLLYHFIFKTVSELLQMVFCAFLLINFYFFFSLSCILHNTFFTKKESAFFRFLFLFIFTIRLFFCLVRNRHIHNLTFSCKFIIRQIFIICGLLIDQSGIGQLHDTVCSCLEQLMILR